MECLLLPEDLQPGNWYWIRTAQGTMQPYRFHRVRDADGKQEGEFYVGSMLVRFSLGSVVAEAVPPVSDQP